MKRSYIGLALGALVAVGAVLCLPSCGHDQKLVSLTIQPATFAFLEPYPTGTEQYTAVGTYIHPPATMDVTSQATWKIDDGVVTLSAPGLFTPAPPPAGSPPGTPPPCGGGNISASVPEGTGGSSNVLIAYATVTVDDPSRLICPGGGTVATLSVGVIGQGTHESPGRNQLSGGVHCLVRREFLCSAHGKWPPYDLAKLPASVRQRMLGHHSRRGCCRHCNVRMRGAQTLPLLVCQ